MSRVLMVDDAGLFQMLEASFLRRLGCEIIRAADGSDILAKAGATRPDLIVLQTERAGCDTPGCVRALKADARLRSIPIVVVTSAERLPDCAAAGADATLVRPVERGALELALCSLGRVVTRRGRRRPARLPARLLSGDAAWRGRVKDISTGGLFVALRDAPPLHAEVQVSLHLPADAGRRAVNARGVVVRRVEADPESHLLPGVGVRFERLDAWTESWIDHYVGGPATDESPGEGEDDVP